MAHTIRDKTRLLNRVRRIRGQIVAIEKALEAEADSSAVLQQIAAARGAMNSLMADVVEGHVRLHVLDHHRKPTSDQLRAADELVKLTRTYLK